MDVAVIGLKVESQQVKAASADLAKLSASAKKTEAAKLRLANAQDRLNDVYKTGVPELRKLRAAQAALATAESQVISAKAQHEAASRSVASANQAAATAANVNAAANNNLAGSAKMAAFRQRQLAVQSVDVAQMLMLGQPAYMVALQQGGQIAQIYAGQGGVSQAFKEATRSVLGWVRANPALVAAGVVTATVFSGMTYEINKTTDVSVGFGDVFMATMHVAKDAISGVLKPAVDAIAPFIQAAWDASVQYTKNKMNSMIGVAVGAYKYIEAEWSNMPSAFADISIMSANALISWAKYGANEVIGIYGDMLAKINSIVGTSFARPGMITDDLSIPNPFAGSAGSTAGVDAFRDAMNFDYLGSTFDAIRDKAVELAVAGQDAGDKLAGAAKKAIDPWKDLRKVNDEAVLQLQKAREYAADLTKGFVSDLRSGLEQGKSFWSSFGSAALNVLNKITDKLLGDVIDAMFRVNNASSGMGGTGNVLSSLFNGLFGGFRASGGPVSSGKAYMVGEQGPEMIVPGASGTVIPNHKLSAANSNSNTYAPTYNVVNNGGDQAAVARLEQTIDKMNRDAYKRFQAHDKMKNQRNIRA